MQRLSSLAVIALACSAFAANPKATQIAKEADRLYKDGKYREAAEALKEAYSLEPNPVLVFNIARAYDQAVEPQLALDAYRQYIGLSDTDPQLVKRANLAMDRLRSQIARTEADKQVQEAEAKRLKDEAEAAKKKAEEEADAARRQREEFEGRERARKAEASRGVNVRRLVAIGIGALALAGGGVGIGFGLLANNSKKAFTTATTLDAKQSLEKATKQNALIADIGLACALVFGITFAIVFPWGSLSGDAQGAVTVALSAQGFALGGTF